MSLKAVALQTESNKVLVDSVSEKIIKNAAQEYVSLNSENFERKSGNVYCLEVSKILKASDIQQNIIEIHSYHHILSQLS